MPSRNDLSALLVHSEWADALMWKSIVAADKDDAELRAKLHHLHMVQWVYLQVWRSEPIQATELAAFPALQDLRVWARTYYGELRSCAAVWSDTDLSREITFPWSNWLVEHFGKAVPALWSDSILQVVMHSMYHRGQIARRLRELGGEPPTTDYITWVWSDRPPAVWD